MPETQPSFTQLQLQNAPINLKKQYNKLAKKKTSIVKIEENDSPIKGQEKVLHNSVS